MLVVLVRVSVKPECVEEFVSATLANVSASRMEPGVAVFDLLRDRAEPASFVLVEGYRDEDAPARHKETAHYRTWRDSVEGMMAAPRSGTRYESVEPTP